MIYFHEFCRNVYILPKIAINVYISAKFMKIYQFWTICYRSIFEQSIWFLIQAKDETPYFLMIKVFCPLKSFLPPFLRIENLKILSFQKSDLQNSDAKKGGKKLLSGVKNFFVKLSQLSTFFWIKNYPHNLKTHFCSSHGVKITWGVSSGGSPLRRKQHH